MYPPYRKKILIFCFLHLMLGGFFILHGNTMDLAGNELGITLDFTYATRYLWHGIDNYQNHGGFQPSVTFDYQGFMAGAWASWPDSSGYEYRTELDYYFGYNRSWFAEDWYALNTGLYYAYVSYPKIDDDLDLQQITFTLSLPRLIPLGPSCVVPTYKMYYDWAGKQGEHVQPDNGWFHTFALSYDIPIPALLPDQKSQAITCSWDITYSDGPLRFRPGWSYTTVGAMTTFTYKRFYFTPAIRYQWGLRDVYRPFIDNDFYAVFSIGYRF